MPNMSYCRFRNTLDDLNDCYDCSEMNDPESLTDGEKRARLKIIELCRLIAADYAEELESAD
jgi:hypothetical protein